MIDQAQTSFESQVDTSDIWFYASDPRSHPGDGPLENEWDAWIAACPRRYNGPGLVFCTVSVSC